ncbi:hypothetical protein ACFXDE_01760 [Kitasatospora sp. NPDC059408]|uniref:hypothetical protein n=1 Tax=Kitasatospora sp. NPDC059408 TaxID=3346823 RepID=UPI00369313FF
MTGIYDDGDIYGPQPTARQRLTDLLGDGPTTALVNELTANAYRRAADVLEAGNPDRSPEFSDGVDWAVDTLRSVADKTAGGAR